MTKHNARKTKLYQTWCGMKSRCNNPSSPSYVNYGGRGITICAEWSEFIPFRDWSFANGYEEGLTIERINNDGDYEPSNCTWIPQSVQAMNRRSTFLVTAFGETKPLQAWVQDPRCLVPSSTLDRRIKEYGWDPEKAISTAPNPPGAKKGVRHSRKDNIYLEVWGEKKTLPDWVDDPRCVVHYELVRVRIKSRGWSPERALTTPGRN